MSDPVPPKVDPETLVLKASPRRVVRFKRNLLIGIAAIGCVAIAGVTWLALKGPGLHPNLGGGNLYDTGSNSKPDDLAGLPSNYGQIPKPKATPQLGPPLPGDLGPPIVQREQQLGLNPAGPNTEDEAARAERLRLAQQAQQASEAGVFFQLNQQGGGASTLASAGAFTSASNPPAAGADASHLNLDLANDQNDQQRKLDVVNQTAADNTYNDHALQTSPTPMPALWPGSRMQTRTGFLSASSLWQNCATELNGSQGARDVTGSMSG